MRKLIWLSCVLGIGCQNEATFVGDDAVSFALTENTPPLIETDEAALYLVEYRVDLPIRDPGDEIMRTLRDDVSDYDNLPFERLPWVGRDDLAIEVDYTVANMDDTSHDLITVTANGISEFTEYLPGFTVDEDDVFADFALWERTHKLGPLERQTFTIRQEEFDEVAVDLATVVNGAPNSNQIVHPDNESHNDVRSQMYIPAVIPGLIAVRLGIRAEETANIVLEASVRVLENNRRFVEGNERLLEATPEIFRPVVPVEE